MNLLQPAPFAMQRHPSVAGGTFVRCAGEDWRMKSLGCLEVRRELANYMEDDVTPELRQRMERHFLECPGCQAVYDGLRNVIRLIGGSEIIELPEGFSRRLYLRLAQSS
jgi:hypothetical protein